MNESGLKKYRLSVSCDKQLPGGGQSRSEYMIGDLMGMSRLHAVGLYWKYCKHLCPTLLDAANMPVGPLRKMKRREIMVREIGDDEPPLPENVQRPQPKPVDLLARACRRTLENHEEGDE